MVFSSSVTTPRGVAVGKALGWKRCPRNAGSMHGGHINPHARTWGEEGLQHLVQRHSADEQGASSVTLP